MGAEMIDQDESGLDQLLGRYRSACPEIEPGPQFMPKLWQKIDSRRSFWSVFDTLARSAMAGCAALALLLLALNLVNPQQIPISSPSYTDALVADHSAEKTYYAESVIRQPHAEDDSVTVPH